MGNRITRTVLFAASAFLSISAFGAGAARFGTLRNSDWVVTNAWQAVSNKTHDLILEIGQSDSMTGIVDRALSYGTENYWTDATGIVWVVVGSTTNIVGRVALTNDIPHPVTVVDPSTNATSGTAADARATGIALYTGFTEWVYTGGVLPDVVYSVQLERPISNVFLANLLANGNFISFEYISGFDVTEIVFTNTLETAITATRHRIRPTKTSQLTNDGDGTNRFATVNNIPLISAADPTFSNAVLAVGLGIDTNAVSEINALLADGDDLPSGGITTIGALLLALVAAVAALKRRMTSAEAAIPYAMYTPQMDTYTAWDVEWTGSSDRATMVWVGNGWQLNGSEDGIFLGGDETSTHFEGEAPSYGFDTYSTTRSLAYGLHEHANNLVDASTGNKVLILPPLNNGKVRDLLVACTIGVDGNDEPWSVIFQGADGEEISFKAEGDDAASATFPVPDAAGDWWYSLTERAPHVFAVSLKQLQSVSQPTQGGS